MILSGFLSADRIHAGPSARLSARLALVDARRRSAQHALDALTEAWRTDASTQQRDQWQDVEGAASRLSS